MANNSVVTQEVLQNTLENYHKNFVYPYLNGATHTGFTPVGTVISYFGETAPEYFLICDGTEYAKSDYPQLADLLLNLTDPTPYEGSDSDHFKVPDLRGEFLRGTGTNGHTNQGSGANVGVHQDATEFPAMITNNSGTQIQMHLPASKSNQYGYLTPSGIDKTYQASFQATLNPSSSTSTQPSQWIVPRPTNTSVLYCIAYKNIYIDLALDSFPISISNPTDGQLLMYDATASRWVNGGHKYSTEEHIVGEWINGKPIYEKTFHCNNFNVTDTISYTNITLRAGIDQCISATGTMLWDYDQSYANKIRLPFIMCLNGAFINVDIIENSNSDYFQIRAWRNRGSTNVGNVYVTLQYTKTTDTV